jgi:hypothetical protein
LSGKNTLGAFNTNGITDWKVQFDGLLGEPLVISGNKTIYGIVNIHPVSRLPKKIIALKGNASLANSGWPRVAHDNRNTSNINKH